VVGRHLCCGRPVWRPRRDARFHHHRSLGDPIACGRVDVLYARVSEGIVAWRRAA
jgi:hypothetical protein